MPKKILILDDSEDILDVLKDALGMEGYEVQGLGYTDDICKAAIDYQADMVILDYILHGINGGELCHILKTTPQTAHLPVIILSAHPRVLESLGNYGSDAIVAKPFDLANLAETIKACFLKAGNDVEHADFDF